MHRGHIVTGTIEFAGERVERMSAPEIVRRGMAQVLEGRRIFAELTVDENLRAGAFTRRDRGQVRETYDSVMTMFPVLAQRRTSTAGYLSGGEQQMLAIGRALMARPRLLLLDEPSLGLAPLVVQQIRDIIAEINRTGTSVLLVEQNATMALSIAHHGYVVQNGRIAKHGAASELLADEEVREFYLGVGECGRRSFRDLKPRRGRWSA
jgi:branched-chain amino acid transport system ATP-binding protein